MQKVAQEEKCTTHSAIKNEKRLTYQYCFPHLSVLGLHLHKNSLFIHLRPLQINLASNV